MTITPSPIIFCARHYFQILLLSLSISLAGCSGDFNDGNSAPVFSGTTYLRIEENTVAVTSVYATDADDDTVTYAISGGDDQALFSIDPTTGVLTCNNAPDYETPQDANTDNDYQLEVSASDGSTKGTASLTISIINLNDNSPIISSLDTVSVPEDTTSAHTIVANDADNDPLAYSITGGADQNRFTIDSNGVLSFISAPDFENPSDADTNNVYQVEITVNDGSNAVSQSISINVTSNNNAPVITSSSTASIAENTTTVLTVTATDSDPLTFSLSGGVDQSRFSIHPGTGVLSFNSAPDFEAPADANTDNVYQVQVQVSDGLASTSQNLSISVTNANDNAPLFITSGAVSLAENITAAITVHATDADGNAISYSLSGGVDASLFSINTSSGQLTFNSAPDFENPADSDTNNTYLVQVAASDSTNTTVQSITITINNTNDNAPSFSTTNAVSIAENTSNVITVNATDNDGDTVTYAITGGVDLSRFIINTNSGVLSFNAAPDFETPLDSGNNNTYEVQVTASDSANTTNQLITVTVTNANDNSPVFTTTAAVTVVEGNTNVLTVNATDADGNSISYSLSGSVDDSLFNINSSSGALSFNSAPDYGTPLDNGGDNIYNIQITASDGTNTSNQQIAITVADATNLPPVINSASNVSINENTTSVITVAATDNENDTITYSLTGGIDQAFFSINSSSGALTFDVAPDFETALDDGGNNTYLVQVGASDTANTSNQLITVTIINTNDNSPAFTTNASVSIAENLTAVMTVNATDADGTTPSYAITGGTDQSLFSINSSSGALSFNSAPDYENPADADTNNTYVVQVTASDGSNTTSQTITVTITNANDNSPSFTTGTSVSIAENLTAVMTINATDADGSTPSYAITGGTDQSLFSINSGSGALSFNSAPDFENPGDADTNNTYVVQVTASDGSNTASQSITVTITNTNDNSPAFTTNASVSIAENFTNVMTVNATDADGTTPSYSITGGADQSLFSINSGSGALSFNSAPDYENPADSDTNNSYLVQVTASDSVNTTDQSITVTITNINEAPVFTSTSTLSVNENTSGTIHTVVATDNDGTTPTYSITGGTDQGNFSINLSSGELNFNSAPDYESPADSDTNNSYVVQVTASDAVNNTNQTITISVNNLNDNSPVFTSASSVNVIEGNTSVLTVNASDADGNSVSYSVSGGLDQTAFSINSSSGVLSFISAPSFAPAGDSNGDNDYIVQVSAFDGSNTTNQSITVTVLANTTFNGLEATRVFPSLTFSSPVLLLQHPNDTDRWYVVEQRGTIQTFQTSSTNSTVFADLTSIVLNPSTEMGLLGMAFHPDFATNNYIYLYYSTNRLSGGNHDSVVVRYTANNETSLDTSSGMEIIRITEPDENHNGGNIIFGPVDNYLYIGTGDGGGAGDPNNNAQNIDSLLGKMLRIDVDNGSPYSNPTDNPYVGTAGRDEIYALGFSNPWRWSFGKSTNDIILGDVGQSNWEEIDIVARGGNYGWRCYEGTHTYNFDSSCAGSYIQPIFEYNHDTGTMPGGYSITGGYVYRGSNIPSLNGTYIFTDYVTGIIWGLDDPYGTPIFSDLSNGTTGLNISSFAQDADGEIYAIHLGGTIYRIDPTP